jgi:hypothetical protein
MLVLYVHLSYSWDLLSYVGPEGWLDDEVATYVRREQPDYAPGWRWQEPPQRIGKGNYCWSIFFHVKRPGWVIAVHCAFLVVLALFTAGLWTRYTSVLAWVAVISYVQRAQITLFGMDTMMLILMTYLAIGPSGDALSVDSWLRRRRTGKGPEPSVSANFAIRLLQVHLCIIYLAGGTSKLKGASWWNGTALNLVLLNYSFAPFDMPFYKQILAYLTGIHWLWEVLVSGGVAYTLFVEVGFPFLVWDRRWRWVMISGAILLHTGIAVCMGLTAFSLMMLTLVLSFVPPEVVRQVLARLRDHARRLLAHQPAPAPRGEPLVMTKA